MYVFRKSSCGSALFNNFHALPMNARLSPVKLLMYNEWLFKEKTIFGSQDI